MGQFLRIITSDSSLLFSISISIKHIHPNVILNTNVRHISQFYWYDPFSLKSINSNKNQMHIQQSEAIKIRHIQLKLISEKNEIPIHWMWQINSVNDLKNVTPWGILLTWCQSKLNFTVYLIFKYSNETWEVKVELNVCVCLWVIFEFRTVIFICKVTCHTPRLILQLRDR